MRSATRPEWPKSTLASRHETIFEGSQIEGALSRRLRQTQRGGGRKDLLSFDAHHKALAKETKGEWGCRARTDPRQASKERGDAQRVAAKSPSGKRRPYLRRAPPGFRGGVRGGALHLHNRQSHSRPAPRNRGKNTTLIASITLEGAMGATMSVEGATDAEAFEAYVEHFLAPSLCEGQVVVLDGVGAHRTQKVRELIEERGADLVLLPSYSPDLNPIEEAFSKIKHLVRKEGVRVREVLVEAIARALSAVTPEDAAGWFAHAGYWLQDQPL